MNAIALIAFIIQENRLSQSRLRIATNILLILSGMGAAAGVLIGLILFRGQRRRGLANKVAAIAGIWLLVLGLLAIILFVPKIPKKPTVKPTETEAVSDSTEENTDDTTEEDTRVPEEGKGTLVAIGDMLMHAGISDQAVMADGSYDYSFLFENIADDIKNADLAVVNNEVIFGGNQLGIQDYPKFNMRTELGDAEIKAGFDIILNATNHTMDQGIAGILNTINYWRKHPEIVSLGLHDTEDDQMKINYIEKNGIKFAVFNFVYGINGFETEDDIPENQQFMVDMMYYNTKDRTRIKKLLAEAKKEADFIIVFPHWGVEYQMEDNVDQNNWAEYFAMCGADLVIGSHSHTIQPVKQITAYTGDSTLCYFSLGNYVSLQNHTPRLLGGMAKVEIVKDASGVHIESHDLIPLVTHYDENLTNVHVYKLSEYTNQMLAEHGMSKSGKIDSPYPFTLNSFHEILRNAGLE